MSGRHVTNQHGLVLHVGGRNRPTQTAESHPHLFRRLSAYRTAEALPTAPDSFDWTTASLTAQAMILANGPDSTAPAGVPAQGLGCCTSACPGHIIDAVTSLDGGAACVIDAGQCVNFYSLSTGYQLGNEATDQGGDEVQVCTYWQQHGYDGNGTHAIAGWFALTDEELADAAFVKSVAWLFPTMFGLELADPWLQIQGDGYVWDVGSPPDNSNGHCVAGLGFNSQGLKINSWGFLGTITYAAIAKFCASKAGGNLFAILTKEAVNLASQKAPSAFDYPALLAFLDSFGGNAPASPTPAPAPAPVPTGAATLANVQAWAAAGIQAGDPMQDQAQAIANVNAGLAKYWPAS